MMNFAALVDDKFNKGDIVQIQRAKLNQSLGIVVSDGINDRNRYQVKSNYNLYDIKSINLTIVWPHKLDQTFGINENALCVFCEKAIPSNCLGKHSCPGSQIMVYCSRECQKQHTFLPSKMHGGPHPFVVCRIYKMVMQHQFPSFVHRFGAIACSLEKVHFGSRRNPFWQSPENAAKLSLWNQQQYEDTLNLCLMKFDIMDRVQNESIINSWSEWYRFHREEFSSFIGSKYSNVLTIYRILLKIGLTRKSRRDIVVHLVGVEDSELNDIDEFQELRVLLPLIKITFICFAPSLAESLKVSEMELIEGIKILVFTGPHNEENIKKLECRWKFRKPDVVIGLDAGLGCYNGEWLQALKYIWKFGIPAYFTEYTFGSVESENNRFLARHGAKVTNVEANPFLQPLLWCSKNTRVVMARNNWLYSIRKFK